MGRFENPEKEKRRMKAMTEHGRSARRKEMSCLRMITVCCLLLLSAAAGAQEANLQALIDEAMRNNPEIAGARHRAEAQQERIPQARALADPTVAVGYQNVGFDRFSLGDEPETQWMFTASQPLPFPGKRALRAQMAEGEAASQQAMYDAVRHRIMARVKELYFDLFLLYKDLDLLRSQEDLAKKVEDVAAARYGAGSGSQQEVIMAQTEKYLLLEKQGGVQQRIQSTEAMLAAALGRSDGPLIGRPEEALEGTYGLDVTQAVARAIGQSPDVKARQRMAEAAQARVKMAQREYFPDFTVSASVYPRAEKFDPIWGVGASVTIPIYQRSRQDPAVREAKAALAQAQQELEAAKLMVASAVRDNYALLKSAENIKQIYREGVIPKTRQDFEQALAGYGTGRNDALVAITRLKNLVENEQRYWSQYADREKALARILALSADTGDPQGK
jgi:outer membrane protein, heavy metal efflux system